MLEQQNICRKCILPDGFLGVHLNSEGLCDFCSNHEHKNVNWSRTKIDSKIREKALIDWNQVVKNMQKNHGNFQYDCILGYSGGKDSTALLDYLVNNLGLNPLAVTSDTGFMTQIAKKNMEGTLAKINVDHVLIENCISTFIKLYKWHFYNHKSNDTFLTRVICDSCSDLIHSIVVKQAIKKDIPYVLFGYSPDQIFRYYYEIPRNEIIHEWKPMLLFNNLFFDKYDSEWYLNDEELKIENLPRVLLPYHVIPYREQKIVNLVESKNYIKKGHADPLLTNCNVVHAATFYDLHRYGGILYAYQYAELVRQNPQERKKWLRALRIVVPLILKNKFKEKEVSDFLESICLSQSELIELIHTQIEQDPKKRQIESIIRLFEK
jgi:PP-loop superfamily ATP-utilizing enzyme